MPGLARAALDGSLGSAGPGSCGGHLRRDRPRLPGCLFQYWIAESPCSCRFLLQRLINSHCRVKSTGLGVNKEVTFAQGTESKMRTFIFACIHNAGRSQMSAAFFNQLAASEKAHGISAGTKPAEHVHPVVVDVMREVGIDLANAKPQKLTEELAHNADMLITMGCGDECPYVPGVRRADWPLPIQKVFL
jgi:arsenate reductase